MAIIENGVCTFAKFGPDWLSGYGFLETENGESIYFASNSLFQNKGEPDRIGRGDLVTFERFGVNRTGRGPAARRTWLKEKAGACRHEPPK